jgi:2-keto-4-pentenoate hydratase/2-oxohepta-3-ene-1,7-dioic acid hydratase in catechol pathway
VLFTKFITTLTGPCDPILLPSVSEQVDYEIELAFVIGRSGKHISEDKALEHVAGYMVINDVSARDLQFADGQWTRGKTFDSSTPCGPSIKWCLAWRH